MTRLFANRRSSAVLVLSLAVLLILPYAFAQETTAGIQGTVRDSTGAVVAKATVEVTSSALIGVKKGETDSAGFYRFSNLPPGDYTFRVGRTGAPIFEDAIAFFECEVRQVAPAGDHDVVIAEVVEAGVRSDAQPLLLKDTGYTYGG